MPVCFQLLDKTSNEPAILAKVDDALREAFGEPPDTNAWLYRWYDRIGPQLAMGRSFDEVKTICIEGAAEFASWKPLPAVVDWLEARYEARSWYER